MAVEAKEQNESLGQELRRLREYQGWTPEAASKKTKISVGQILDIESDNYSSFPSVSYVRGFVRIYARALGLDDRKVVAKLDGKLVDDEPSLVPLTALDQIADEKKKNQKKPVTEATGNKLVGIVVLVMIGSAVLAIYKAGGLKRYHQSPEATIEIPKAEVISPVAPGSSSTPAVAKAEPVASKASKQRSPETPVAHAEPVAVPVGASTTTPPAKPEEAPQVFAPQAGTPRAEVIRPAEPVAAPSVPVVPQLSSLAVQASSEAWIRVIVDGQEGSPAYDGLMTSGQSITLQGQRFYIKARPPKALSISINGEAPRLLGESSGPQEFHLP